MSDYAELGWTVQAEWLTRLAASPRAEARELGDGFAVLSGVDSNAHNGVVCSAGVDDAAIAGIVEWFQAAGAPAQWLVEAGSALGPQLVAAGCRAERTAVVMGAEIADLPLDAQPPDGVEIVVADRGRWIAVAQASSLFEDAEREGDLLHAVDGATRLLALRDGRPVGIAGSIVVGETVYLQYLAVRESERGRGVGRSLTAARLRAAPGCRRALLDPAPDAIAFHRRLGFELSPALRDRVYYLPALPPAVGYVLAAIRGHDWETVRLALHPYLFWDGADGTTLKGRKQVLAMLAQAPVPPPPSSVELRDGQVYRWRR